MFKNPFALYREREAGLNALLDEANQRISKLNRDLCRLESENHTKKILLERLHNSSTDIRSHAIIFSKINAFSIERLWVEESKTYQTVIGYIAKSGAIREWWLNCNQEAHEDFVKQFLEYKRTQ